MQRPHQCTIALMTAAYQGIFLMGKSSLNTDDRHSQLITGVKFIPSAPPLSLPIDAFHWSLRPLEPN